MTPALVFKEGPLAGRRVEVVSELVIGRVESIEWVESDSLDGTDRGDGGFGSTGVG